jgi:hypothetical protein
MKSIITSLIFLFVLYAIYYVEYHSKNPNVQIKIDNLNILQTKQVI